MPFDRIFDRLDATPAQRRIILSAAAEVGARTHALTTDLGGIRRELADSIRGDRIDEAAFARASEQAQALARSLGDPLGRTLVKVHECLDPRQRHILADLVEHGFV